MRCSASVPAAPRSDPFEQDDAEEKDDGRIDDRASCEVIVQNTGDEELLPRTPALPVKRGEVERILCNLDT